jgi:hypothetical protein
MADKLGYQSRRDVLISCAEGRKTGWLTEEVLFDCVIADLRLAAKSVP